MSRLRVTSLVQGVCGSVHGASERRLPRHVSTGCAKIVTHGATASTSSAVEKGVH